MFTLDQIKTAHAKVKSGADFPGYVQELKALGVVAYDNYVSDGNTLYYGTGDFQLTGTAKYPPMEVADIGSVEKLNHAISVHQQGQADYMTFCRQAAEAGVEKWTVHMVRLTCMYYDKAGNELVTEEIPVP